MPKVCFTASPTPPCPFFILTTLSPLQYTMYPASTNIDCPLRRVSCMPITSHPNFPKVDSTSHTQPIPCFPSTAMVRTLCVAIQTSCRLVLARFLSACFFARRRSVLPLHLFLRASSFPCFLLFVNYTASFPFPCSRSRLTCWSRGPGSAILVRVGPHFLHAWAESCAY